MEGEESSEGGVGGDRLREKDEGRQSKKKMSKEEEEQAESELPWWQFSVIAVGNNVIRCCACIAVNDIHMY